MNLQEQDYREFLRRELESRCQRNPRYSLRSFARDLGMAPARLSDVLRGRYGLSRASATAIADRLELSREQKEIFCDLVESRHGRSELQRGVARARLLKHENRFNTIALDSFQVISDWYHFAILELVGVEDFQNDPAWIAKALGIGVDEASAAVDRLLRLEFLKMKEGTLVPAESYTATPSGVASEAIRKFHKQILKKAEAALEVQPVDRRDFSAVTFAIERSRLPEAKRVILEFRRNFCERFSESKKKDDVYVLAMHFFSLREPT